MTGYAARPLPEAGAWRVHPAPNVLPRLTGDGPGANRYDDPEGQYTVRYVAENLTGALIETMARFRPAPAAEALLASIDAIEPEEEQHLDATDGVRGTQHLRRNFCRRPLASNPSSTTHVSSAGGPQ